MERLGSTCDHSVQVVRDASLTFGRESHESQWFSFRHPLPNRDDGEGTPCPRQGARPGLDGVAGKRGKLLLLMRGRCRADCFAVGVRRKKSKGIPGKHLLLLR